MQMPDLKTFVSDRRYAAALGLGISSGLPLPLVYSVQAAWLKDVEVPISTIGLLSEMSIAYKLKFLWAPFLERYELPVLGAWLGRRRGWILLMQFAAAVALGCIAFGNPAHSLTWTIVFSVALGFAASTQDIVIDDWRINAMPAEKMSVITSVLEIGWRVGNLISAAGALYMAQFYGWRAAYLAMAVAMMPGIIATMIAPEPDVASPPSDGQGFVALVVTPIKDLVGRLGSMAWPILLLVAGFRMPGYIAMAMATPLFKTLDYSNADIATVTKLFGFGTGIAATMFAAFLVPRIGLMATLLIGTVAGSSSHLALAWLAVHGGGGHDFWAFAIAVSIDSFAYAFASYVLIMYMSTLTVAKRAGSQFALLSSVVAIPGSMLAAVSGFAVESVGFTWFFVGTSLIGLPVAILCLYVWSVDARVRRASASQPGSGATAST